MNHCRFNSRFMTSWSKYAIKRQFCTAKPETRTVLTAKLDDSVDKAITDGLHPKKHPGRRSHTVIHLPVFLEMSAKNIIDRHLNNRYREDVSEIITRVHEHQKPDEPHEIREKQKTIVEKVLAKETVDVESLEDVEKEYHLRKRQKRIDRLMELETVTWKDFEYDDRKAVAYLGARLTQNYTAMISVFEEIRAQDSSFQPKTLLDYGSGIGTTMYAANEIWPSSLAEHFNCDVSKSMNDLSRLILQGGKEDRPLLYPGVFYRQFLPVTDAIKYDLVVSSFTLLELPNQRSRVQAIENLWNKTQDLLVIVEHGTRSGFSTVLEARNLVLSLSGYDVSKSYYNDPKDVEVVNYDPEKAPNGHILAPCAHTFACPRQWTGGPVKCNFERSYKPFDLGIPAMQRMDKIERFSYVVLRKGPPKYDETSHWPRIVQEVKCGKGHRVTRLCCPDGTIRMVSFTSGKHKGNMYQCAKSSKWGDRLPATVVEQEKPLSFWGQMKANKAAQEDGSTRNQEVTEGEMTEKSSA